MPGRAGGKQFQRGAQPARGLQTGGDPWGPPSGRASLSLGFLTPYGGWGKVGSPSFSPAPREAPWGGVHPSRNFPSPPLIPGTGQ